MRILRPEYLDDLLIGNGKGEVFQFVQAHPTPISAVESTRVPIKVTTLKDVQADAEVRVAVLDRSQVLAHFDLDTQFLSNLAAQTVGQRFAGLAFAVGMLVDNAVVVLENIYRRIEKGEEPLLAAYKGARQVAFAGNAQLQCGLIAKRAGKNEYSLDVIR